MQPNKPSDKWLFERHAKHTVKAWLKQLRYFYYKRAWAGMQTMVTSFRWHSRFQANRTWKINSPNLG